HNRLISTHLYRLRLLSGRRTPTNKIESRFIQSLARRDFRNQAAQSQERAGGYSRGRASLSLDQLGDQRKIGPVHQNERADDGVSCSGQSRRRKDDSLHSALFVVIGGPRGQPRSRLASTRREHSCLSVRGNDWPRPCTTFL